MHSELVKRFTEGTRIAYDAGFVNNRRQILQAVLAARGDVRNHVTQDVRRKNGDGNAALALRGRLRLLENASHDTRTPLKIPANAARRPSDLGAGENVHFAAILIPDFRRFCFSEEAADACAVGLCDRGKERTFVRH
jgi:hypothetical protein